MNRTRHPAVSAVLGMVIGLGITSAVGGGVYYLYQEQADLFASSSQIEVRNLNVIRSDDTISISANMKNIGSTAITDVFLSEAKTGSSTSGLTMSMDDEESLVTVSLSNGTDIDSTADGFEVRGLSHNKGTKDSPDLEVVLLDGGATKAVKIDVQVADLADFVTISDRMTFQLAYSSGNDEFLSDIYHARVRPG